MPSDSKLETLEATNCSITDIDESLIRQGLRLDVGYNKIQKLPREAMIEYLEKGGKFHRNEGIKFYLNFDHNPLIYIPQFIYEKGEEACLDFLKSFSPESMIVPKEVGVTLVGDSLAGKTSVCLTLSSELPKADSVAESDRTEAFDIHESTIDDARVKMTDIGGQLDYNLLLPILCRSRGLFLLVASCLTFLTDFAASSERLWKWVEKVRENAFGANFLVIFTKIDEMSGNEEDKKKNLGKLKEDFGEFCRGKLKEIESKLRASIESREKEKAEFIEMNKHKEDDDVTLEINRLDRKISQLKFQLTNVPKMNVDLTTFFSAKTGEIFWMGDIVTGGVSFLQRNIGVAISRLFRIALPESWLPKQKSIWELFSTRLYVKLQDLYDSPPSLESRDFEWLMTALNGMGRIVWSPTGARRQAIFHNVRNLAQLMKSMFHHAMIAILKQYSVHVGWDAEKVAECFMNGKIPLAFVRSMFFFHAMNDSTEFRIVTDYENLHDYHLLVDDNLDRAFESFLATLEDYKIMFMDNDETIHERVLVIPFYNKVTKAEIEVAKQLFTSSTDVGVKFRFDTEVSKSLFSQSCIAAFQLFSKVTNLMGRSIDYIMDVTGSLMRFGSFEILMTMSSDKSRSRISILLRNANKKLRPEAAWFIILNVVSVVNDIFHTCIPICTLICPKAIESDGDDHNELDIDFLLTHEKIVANSRLRDKKTHPFCKCEKPLNLTQWFPTELAQKIFEHEAMKALWTDHQTANSVALSNLIFVLLTQVLIPSSSTITELHPALMNGARKEKFLKNVREFFAKLEAEARSKCQHVRENCLCFLSDAEYVDKFEKLEENQLLVTEGGTWKEKMDEIYQTLDFKETNGSPKKCKGSSFSVTKMTRELRNAISHEKPDMEHLLLMKMIEEFFKWIIMHAFSFREIFILPKGKQMMKQFADAYRAQEKSEMSKGLMSNEECLMIQIQSISGLESSRETLMYFDLNQQVKQLQSEISQRFCIPTERQSIFYEGPQGAPKENRPLTDLKMKIRDLVPDTRSTQVFSVKEKDDEKVDVFGFFWSLVFRLCSLVTGIWSMIFGCNLLLDRVEKEEEKRETEVGDEEEDDCLGFGLLFEEGEEEEKGDKLEEEAEKEEDDKETEEGEEAEVLVEEKEEREEVEETKE